MNLTLVMMCCDGSSGMMVTSGLTPNGQQSCNPSVPLTTESWQDECICHGSGPRQLIWEFLIPCPPVPDHLKVWMFKVDDLSHWNLMPNHYLCIQYARALQFAAATTTSAVMCWPAESLTAFITSMSPFYTITEDMW